MSNDTPKSTCCLQDHVTNLDQSLPVEENNLTECACESNKKVSDVNEEKLSEEENKSEVNSFSFTENSDLYVISVDGVPNCYVKDEEIARKRIWDLARLYSSRKNFNGWQTSFVKISHNELHILGSYRLFLIAYDKVLRRLSYEKIKECV